MVKIINSINQNLLEIIHTRTNGKLISGSKANHMPESIVIKLSDLECNKYDIVDDIKTEDEANIDHLYMKYIELLTIGFGREKFQDYDLILTTEKS